MEYCSDNPAENCPNTVNPTETDFGRTLGAVRSLACQAGYLPEDGDTVDATCQPVSNEVGEWVCSDRCSGILLVFY